MPANPMQLIKFNFLKLSTEIPPSAMIGFLLKLDNNLNLYKPKKFLFFLNSEDKKIDLTFCTSLVLIS